MNKKIISTFLSLTMGLTIYSPIVTKGAEPSKINNKAQTIEKLNSLSDGKLKLSEKSGQVFLTGNLSTKQVPGESSALKFMDENKFIFGIDNAAKELKVTDVKKDELGHTYVKLEQLINGLKVDGSTLNLHFDKKGVIVSVNGKLEKNKSITTLGNEAVSESDAVEIAKKQFTYKSLRNTPKAEKMILTKDNKNYEVYKVNIFYMEPTIENNDVYVEAHSGQVIKTESNLRYDGPVSGTGIDVNGTQRDLKLYQSGASYQMKDLTNPATAGIRTYDSNHGTTEGNIVSNSTNSFNSEDYKASVSAHYNAEQVINFYKNLFNRNSLDNNGMAINSFTHYDNNYNNAFWDGAEMIYGDGDKTEYTYLSGDLDIVGHEMTHGVISSTADLWYHNQSGALNESIADVFGVLIETYNKYNVANGGSWSFNPADWVVGDDVYTPNIPGDSVRSLANPTLDGQPDNMSHYITSADTTDEDNGGVHINSGIPNKAAYNIASLIGMDKTAKIYYRALTNYMSTYTDFEGAKDCLVLAAADLYGQNSTEVTAINTAFTNVGVIAPSIDDPYEPNSTIASAYPINIGTTYQSYISTNTDEDYYKLHVTATGGFKILLSDLPDDFDLDLYNSSGELLKSSINLGTLPDSIEFAGNAGDDYYIRVYTYGAFSTTQKYSLLVTKKVTGVSLNTTSAILKIGDSLALQAAVNPSDASDKNVTWTSSDSTVASVDNTGKVTALKEGTAAITVSTEDGSYSAVCQVYINQHVTGISLNKTSVLLKPNSQETLSTIVQPSYAANKNITWSSSNPTVASVSNGIVNALKPGTAVVTATSEDGGYTAACTVNVDNGVSSVAITGTNIPQGVNTQGSLKKGDSITLSVIVSPSDTLFDKGVTWSSDNSGVAQVDSNGKVTALARGTATITAKSVSSNNAAYCKITVSEDSSITNSRLGGKDRFETATAVSRAGWTTSDNVVLANGLGFADALTGVPMAYIKDAPILLTEANSIPNATNSEIIRLNAKNIYILGGTGVVGKNIEDSLRARGYNVIRVSGINRFETAIAIGNEVLKSNNTDTAILTTANDYPDALAISPYAAIKKYPVLYTDTKTLTPSTKAFLIKNGIKKVIIPGGEGAVSAAVANELTSNGITVDRTSGINRYQTALNIVNKYKASFDYDVILATGQDFPDALSGGVLAAKKKIPILLAENKTIDPGMANYIKSNGRITMYILGGTGVIPDNIISK
ncbi:cell wall-binding repeat-containing protein [Candidatus Clostridium radicumherbarum]|uniref:Cell wall-binding repeat-containing protein n=1 Tax=Candidatus Clostridium radicumherbarum TaxID=3381662 RepID=A0ABW8TTK4_9CLOT